jgi:sugar phosphate permease
MVTPANNKPISHMRRYRLYIFLSLSAAYLISYFHRAAPAVVGPEITRELSLAPASLGLLGSMYFWAYAATALPAGILADSWGARKTIAVFVFLAGVGGIVFAIAPSLSLMALGRFVIGIGVGVVYVAAMRIMADWYKPNELATFSGILLAVGNVGALISTTPLVFLMDRIGWRPSFCLVAGLTVLASGVAYAVIRNTPIELGFPSPTARPIASHPVPAQPISSIKAVRLVFGSTNFYLLGILLFSYYGTFMGVGSLWAGPYLRNIYGLSKLTVGNVLMMFPLGMVLGCPLAGYISDKVLKSRKSVLMWGCLAHISCYIPFILSTGRTPVISLYILFFWYGLTGGAFVACFACAKETCDPRFAGTAVGSLNIFLFTGGAFYQYVMGVVINRYPVVSPGVYPLPAYRAAFLVCLSGLIVGTIVFAFFKEEAQKALDATATKRFHALPTL